MADLDRRLRSLDSIPAPDIWSRVGTSSEERPVPPFPSRWRRVGIATVALSLSVLAFMFAFDGWRDHRDRPQPAGQIVSVAGRVRQGKLLCTVTAPAVVDPGDPLGLVFTIENQGERSRSFSTRGTTATSYVVVDGDGAVYDSVAAYMALGLYGPGFMPPTEVAPGETWTSPEDRTLVRWDGPLTITPTCLGTELPALAVDVGVSGPPPTVAEAISASAGATGELLEACTPIQQSEPTLGTIAPPTADDAPDMTAACSATVTPHDGFALVRMEVVTPSDAQGAVQVSHDPYHGLESFSLPDDARSIEVVIWDVVVTQDRAVVVGGRTVARTASADAMFPGWGWSGSGWEPGGMARCGGLFTGGGLNIEFISVCPPSGNVRG
jgi:hypothetical protein